MNDSHTPIVPAASPQAAKNLSKQRGGKENWRSIVSTVAILLIAPLFALFLITFVFQSYLVDGPSMETTLQDKDRLIVWKVPRTWAKLTGNPYIPKKGDVVVFTEPALAEFGQKSGKQLIKRVIALPGERVIVRDGKVTVFNAESPEGFEPAVTLPDGTPIGNTPGELEVTVPDGHVFVLGDNRTNSLDSRTFGPIASENIVGKLTFRFLPLGGARHF